MAVFWIGVGLVGMFVGLWLLLLWAVSSGEGWRS